MEENYMCEVLSTLLLVAMVLGLLVLGPDLVECASVIQLNPCTLPQCIAECKKDLWETFLTETCAMQPQGKFCICLG
ncbi:hypothetical protein I3760_11G004700 [Carya illinoinensis]|nr:hypothetical protein I3760_11G004700 [Carya illinoinensis]